MRAMWGVLLVSCVCLCIGYPARSARARPIYTGIAMLTIGKVAPELQHSVKNYIEDQYGVAVTVREAVPTAPDDLKVLKRILADQIRPTDACLLALSALPAVKHQGIVYKEDRLGIVNVSALKPDGEGASSEAELFGRRADKESLRAVALMMGVAPCPFPRCALVVHQNDEQLDFKSRNPCPPCLKTVREKLEGMGLKLTGDSPPKGAAVTKGK